MDNSEKWLARLTVLYVEDEPGVRENIAKFLQRRFKKVYVAEDGRAGLKLFREHKPHMVISDVRMPVMDGLQMSREIRRLQPDAHIILTTAHSETDLMIQAIDIGVSQFVLKPISREKLLESIGRTMRDVLLREKEHQQIRLIQKILDSQDSLIVVADRSSIIGANRAALEYFQCSSLQVMAQNYSCIRPFFLDEDGCFFPRTENWHQEAHGSCKIKMLDSRTHQGRYFVMRVKKFPMGENISIITLTDMTDLEHQQQELEKLATVDPLTGLHNRAKCSFLLNREIQYARRYRSPLSVVMLAVDYRDDIDVSLGQECSDEVLLCLATLLKENIRNFDILGRWDDEELMIIAPNSDHIVIQNLVHRLRGIVAQHEFPFVGSITCSFSIAEAVEGEDEMAFARSALEALRHGQTLGRNLIIDARSMEVVSSDLEAIRESESILARFREVHQRRQQVHLSNCLKGMCVQASVSIAGLGVDSVDLILPRKQFYALLLEKKVYLESELLGQSVLARLRDFDKDQMRVTLKEFSFKENRTRQRRYVRLQVPDTVKIIVASEGNVLQERLFDLSLQSATFHTMAADWLREGMEVEVTLVTGARAAGYETIQARGTLQRVEGIGRMSIVALLLQCDRQNQESLKEYIARRQIEIIQEANEALL
ncbi:response regulator [Desulfurispirillum indicum]|uniref:response regulator n=1 Tax=Desulfurispirillum indicum TaxID=936456 RepID=UPI001CFA9652|nr:response regulator [Desulfurispirillum indicum]UCZ55738.1 response regulator [Desulfurispirillum indicum]